MPQQHSNNRISLRNVGPVTRAEVELGDLTALVGPQASGKSVFLQTMKLALDRHHITWFFKQHGIEFNGNAAAFLDGYYERGMGGMLAVGPQVKWGGGQWKALESLTRCRISDANRVERLFYIPAQRVIALHSGVSRPFSDFRYGDPYVLRYFAHQVHVLLQNEFGPSDVLFPVSGRLNEALRAPIADTLFHGAELRLEQREFTKSLVLKVEGLRESLTFLAWSAGQREFAPLLFGLYWLCPAGKISRREGIEWVVIEEPEMGLHPRAIATFLLLTLELLRRGYKVVISTHSTAVLDLIWALRHIQASGKVEDIRKLFDLPAGASLGNIVNSAYKKQYRVYFFEREQPVKDITALDPGDETVSSWGDLNGFSGRTADVVADVFGRQ